jgi:hypothetical protein
VRPATQVSAHRKEGKKREFSSYRTWVIIQPSSVAFSKRWNQFLQGKWCVNTLRRSFMCLKCGISVCLRYRQQLEWNASRINLGHLNSTQIEDIFSARNRIMLCAHVLFSLMIQAYVKVDWWSNTGNKIAATCNKIWSNACMLSRNVDTCMLPRDL